MYKNIATAIYMAMAKDIVIAACSVVFTVAIIATADISQACRLIEIHICSYSNIAIRKPIVRYR